MTALPECTVIMPSYNSRAYIGKSVDSVLTQTFQSWELIIVDDGSTDGTAKYVESEYVNADPRINLIRLEKNGGAAVARNKAIEKAKGRFIAFLDSDDLWLPQKLELQIEFMKTNGFAFTYTGHVRVNQDAVHLNEVRVPDSVNYQDLLKTNVIGCLTAVYDTEILGKVYMPIIKKPEDFGLWLRLLRLTPRAYGLNQDLAVYTVREGSVSANKAEAARYTWTLYREVERLSILRSAYYFAHYAVRGALRKSRSKWMARLRLI